VSSGEAMSARIRGLWDRLPRPLDPFASFKVKTGLLVGGAITSALFVFYIGASWQFRYALLAALVTALVFTQFVAHGMTSPLREMTAAARTMARGDYRVRVRATSRDEIGQLATAFNQMAADLEAADEYRRGLIGNVSHELKTPITALRALLENVVDGVARPDAETLRMALAQTERLGELVTNLLDLSRVEGGAIPLQLSSFEVDRFLREAVDHVSVSPGDVQVDIAVTPAALRGVADPARLRQVVVNLVDNAVRHSPPGGRVHVHACAADPSGLRLEVSDQGPGIAPAERERVFQRFSRGATSEGGTGLGLAIARWAVELHNGTIDVVDSREGCRIAVTIPDPASGEEQR
jgi:signal transduction histidine kinase